MESLLPDKYSFEARVVPVLIVCLPVVVGVAAWSDSLTLPAWLFGATMLSLLGVWLGHVGRERGKRIEPGLYASWGGGRSTARLRCKPGENEDRPALDARRRCAVALLPGTRFPNEEDELQDALKADAVYDRAVGAMFERTRGNVVVESANRAYGFYRNSLGLKPIGLASATLGVALVVARLWWTHERTGTLDVDALPYLFGALACAAWHVLGVNQQAVRRQNERLADALYRAVESLNLPVTPPLQLR